MDYEQRSDPLPACGLPRQQASEQQQQQKQPSNLSATYRVNTCCKWSVNRQTSYAEGDFVAAGQPMPCTAVTPPSTAASPPPRRPRCSRCATRPPGCSPRRHRRRGPGAGWGGTETQSPGEPPQTRGPSAGRGRRAARAGRRPAAGMNRRSVVGSQSSGECSPTRGTPVPLLLQGLLAPAREAPSALGSRPAAAAPRRRGTLLSAG